MDKIRINGKLDVTLYLDENIAKELSKYDIDRLINLVSWNEFAPDSLSEARHAIQKLSEPLALKRENSLDGSIDLIFNSLKIKGIHYKKPTTKVRTARWTGKENPSDTAMPDESFLKMHEGFGQTGLQFGFDKKGHLKPLFAGSDVPQGVCLLRKIIEEHYFTKKVFESGLNSCLPLGYGIFNNIIYNGLKTGFLVMVIHNEKDMRLSDQINYQLKDRDASFFKCMFYNLGKQYRQFMQKGFTTMSMHLEDIALDSHSDFSRPFFHDLNPNLSLGKLNLKQLFGHVAVNGASEMIHNIMDLDFSATEKPSGYGEDPDWNAYVDAAAKAYESLKNKKTSPLRSFLNGFFYDDSERIDELLSVKEAFNINLLLNLGFGVERFAAYDCITKERLEEQNVIGMLRETQLRDLEMPKSYEEKVRHLEQIKEEEISLYNYAKLHDYSNAIPYFLKLKAAFDRDHAC